MSEAFVKPELYAILMEYIESNSTITEQLCRELLAEYDLTFNVDADVEFHKKLRDNAQKEYGGFRDDGDDSYFRNSGTASREKLNKTSNSADLGAKNINTGRDRSTQPPRKKKDMFHFVEWNFQKRAGLGGPKTRNRKDHPSFPIMIKILEKN